MSCPPFACSAVDNETDLFLVGGLRNRDESAFDTLVNLNRDRLFNVAMRILRNEDDAHDAVQTAFLAVLRSIDHFEAKSRVTTWLHRIVVNASLMQLRTRRRHPERSLSAILEGSKDHRNAMATKTRWADSPEGLLLRKEERARLRATIADLKPQYREVIEMRDCQELSMRRTAKRLAITPSATKVRLHRARRALRTKLQTLQLEVGKAGLSYGRY